MLSEGAKPGTPRIEPSRIFGTSLELRIVVRGISRAEYLGPAWS
jgi:hypothetical protein